MTINTCTVPPEVFDFDELPSSEGGFTPAAWECIRATGVLRAPFPVAHGGSGHTLPEVLEKFERLGQSNPDPGLSFVAATTAASVGVPLSSFGSAAQRDRYLPQLCAGDLIGAHAITEAVSGSDALAMSTRARRDGEDFVLNGTKTFVTNAGIADLYAVYARTAEEPGPFGLTTFLVPSSAPGLLVRRLMPTMGLRTAPVGELELTDVRVPADHIVAGVGRGFLVLDHVMQREILLSFITNVGEMARRLDMCLDWARQRRQYGQPIGSYQAIAHRLVDMRIATESARMWLHSAAAKIERGENASAEVAMAKLVTSEANLSTSLSATRVFGGRGYLQEFGLEQGVRDAVGGGIYSGTNEIQYNRVAALMGLR